MPTIYCYVRDSPLAEVDLVKNRKLCEQAAARLANEHGLRVGQCFCDDDLAFRKPLLARPAGGELNGYLEPGDWVVMACPEQGFRHLKEMADRARYWSDRGIFAHFVVGEMETDEDVDRLSSRLRSNHTRESIARRQATSQFAGGRTSVGYTRKPIGGGRTRAFPDRKMAPLARLVAYYHDHCGMGFVRASARVRALLKRRGVKYDEVYRWDRTRTWRLYKNYAKWYGRR